MRTRASCAGIVLFIFFVFGSCGKQDDFSVLKGPYLGQTPSGTEPEIFAPGLITTHYSQSYIVFLNEARVCVYSAGTEKGHETYYTYEKNGHWTSPQTAPFEELQGHPNYTTGPLGRKVYFHSGRPTHPDDTRQDDNIWTIEWTGSGWAQPEVLPVPVNSDYGEAYPSAAADGTVYFFTWRRPGTRGDDIWISRCIGGHYQEAERLPWPINTDFIEYDPYIAPDESFLIFGSTRPGGYGRSDNYICFRKEDGSWTSPINLGRPFNSSSYDLCANGTPDGKYFFFISGRKTDVDKGHIGKKSGEEPGEDSDLYWADFSFIDDLKNTVLTKQNAAEVIKQDYEEKGIHSAVDTMNKLYSSQTDNTHFSPFELLSLCKNMIIEERTGDADLFFSALNEVLPEDLSIKEGYARFCAMNGRVSKGLKILEELESEDPNFDLSDSLSGLGYLFTLYPDKTEDALSVLQFTVEKFPEDWFAYYSLARVYRQLGDLDNAIAYCRKALEIRPSVGDVSQLLERLLKEQEEKKADSQKKESFPVLKGPYLGQKPPRMTPEVFAPEIISTEEKYELNSIFSLKGDEFYYEISTTTQEEKKKGIYFYIIMVSKQVNGIWTKPEMAPFSGKYSTMDMCFSPDGTRMYFTSDRPFPWDSAAKNHLWYVDRLEEGWSEPEILGPPIYSPDSTQSQPSIAKDGTIYFRIGDDLYYSKNNNGEYSKPTNLGNAINSQYPESKPFISPDESFLLFVRYDMPESIDGGRGLYISYKREDGSWTPAKNTNINGSLPKLTPDGKYFFFSRGGDIYWADAKIIEELKPGELRLNPCSNGSGPPHDWPVLQGPYFGQKLPTGEAEIFMDGVISKLNEDEMCAAFTADGKEFYFNAYHRGNWTIFMTREVDGQWMRPSPMPFTSNFTDRDFTMSPDGNMIFFGSNRPRKEGKRPSGSLDIFVTERLSADRWSEPKSVGYPINTNHGENYPSCAQNGNLYFFSSRKNGFGGCDIYVSRWKNGRYSAPENLGSAVNSDEHDWDAVIAPDESVIIFSSQDRVDSVGEQDLYISYRADDGGWTAARNMGPAVNSPHDEICPSLSLDGKCLFFTSRRRGKADIFWIDAKIVEDLRPKDSKFQ